MTRLCLGSATALHLLKPYWNNALSALNRLDFFHFPPTRIALIPSALAMVQLNFFTGRAYVDRYQEYVDACRVLRFACQTSKAGLVTANDGFIEDSQDPSNATTAPHESPVAFIQPLLDIRAHHCDITKSHMGKLLEGYVLQAFDINLEVKRL